MQQHFFSDHPWTDVLVDNPPPGRVEWGSAALQGFLQFNWHFGVQAAPAPAVAPAAATPGSAAGAPGPAK